MNRGRERGQPTAAGRLTPTAHSRNTHYRTPSTPSRSQTQTPATHTHTHTHTLSLSLPLSLLPTVSLSFPLSLPLSFFIQALLSLYIMSTYLPLSLLCLYLPLIP